MSELIYKITFLSDWHCGSGLTSGSDIDALVIKDENDLPFVPGKTIKGLLKEAAYILGEFSEDKKNKEDWNIFRKHIFGLQTTKLQDDNQSEPGACFFSNAVLSDTLKNKIIESIDLKSTLYRKIASTQIDKNGIAEEKSLRKIEVVIPLELYGQITNIDEKYFDKMIMCIAYIKQLGSNRNRGLGRCIISKWEGK
ncbi:CRISPR-associated protein [Candidatus Magnetomorum sp. HK-1]|nr:CRISPR-associated protein [Candidatus Magnetomorum sp. HK-1]